MRFYNILVGRPRMDEIQRANAVPHRREVQVVAAMQFLCPGIRVALVVLSRVGFTVVGFFAWVAWNRTSARGARQKQLVSYYAAHF